MNLCLYTTAHHRGGWKNCAMDYLMPQRTGSLGADGQSSISFVGSCETGSPKWCSHADFEWLTLFIWSQGLLKIFAQDYIYLRGAQPL